MGTRRKLWWIGLLYFAEGLPFGLFLDLFPVYFRAHGVALTDIGSLSALRMPWSLKFLWAPFVDRIGTRRRWITGALFVIAAALLVIGGTNPAPVTMVVGLAILAVATASATQDVAIDAYTIALVAPGEEGVANGVRVSTYRAALIVAGGAFVALAARLGWPATFTAAAALCLATALLVQWLPAVEQRPTTTEEWWRAMREWLARPGAFATFLFILLYKLGDQAMGPMVKPFWIDRGFALEEIALVSGTFGVAASVAGALAGGWLTSRWGLYRSLWLLGLAQALSNLGYAGAAAADGIRPAVYAASLVESFTGGLGTAAFLAFLMHVCDKQQAATQYALLSALFSLTGSLAGVFSGFGATTYGYAAYFALTFGLSLPAYAVLPWVRARLRDELPAPSPGG